METHLKEILSLEKKWLQAKEAVSTASEIVNQGIVYSRVFLRPQQSMVNTVMKVPMKEMAPRGIDIRSN